MTLICRLRPNGENGLAVCSFEMFSRYQRNMDGNGAWLWEHQALTRARFVAGDPELGRRFEQERAEILRMPRAIEPLKAEVLEMRRKMLEGHPNRTTQFDLKHSRGGMVDVEFIVQFMVLGWSASHPELVNNFGNILLLEMSARLGLLDSNLAQAAVRLIVVTGRSSMKFASMLVKASRSCTAGAGCGRTQHGA